MARHIYTSDLCWTGNSGSGTSSYKAYERSHVISGKEKSTEIFCSSDPAFRGDKSCFNPEELFVASVASCHMLWYLHLCADAGVVIESYVDRPTGVLEENEEGGKMTQIDLNPLIVIRHGSDLVIAQALHKIAHQKCFIAASIKTPVIIKAEVRIQSL